LLSAAEQTISTIRFEPLERVSWCAKLFFIQLMADGIRLHEPVKINKLARKYKRFNDIDDELTN